jgi:hypothetical protein
MCCIGIEPSTAPWSLAAFASGRVFPASTVRFASLTVLTIACLGNPLGTAKTADATSIEQTLANANEIDFMIHPYGFYDRSAIAIATSSYSDSLRESRGAITRACDPLCEVAAQQVTRAPLARLAARRRFSTGSSNVSRRPAAMIAIGASSGKSLG